LPNSLPLCLEYTQFFSHESVMEKVWFLMAILTCNVNNFAWKSQKKVKSHTFYRFLWIFTFKFEFFIGPAWPKRAINWLKVFLTISELFLKENFTVYSTKRRQ
jgi:hypothetical protein